MTDCKTNNHPKTFALITNVNVYGRKCVFLFTDLLTSVKFNTLNLFQEFSLSPGWKTPWACPGADGIRDSDVTIFH